MSASERYRRDFDDGTFAELRIGRWQDVLADVERCEVVLTDPPYSARTHDGERGLRLPVGGTFGHGKSTNGPRAAIAYESLGADEPSEFVKVWSLRAERWSLCFGDHATFALWESAWKAAGWVTFQPVLWIKRAAPPRFAGDGPASAAEYISVARPRQRVREHASRAGWYHVDTCRKGKATGVIGTKDVDGLAAILADYSRPVDLVADPYAGTATVGAACIRTGRSYIGSELDPDTYAKGVERLRHAQPPMPGMAPDRWRDRGVKQEALGL